MGKQMTPTQALLPVWIACFWVTIAIFVSIEVKATQHETQQNSAQQPSNQGSSLGSGNNTGVTSENPREVLGGQQVFYNTTDNPISTALEEISFLTKLSIQGINLPEGLRVSGEFSAADTFDFLNEFTSTFELDWFYINELIVVTSFNDRKQITYSFNDEIAALNFRRDIDRQLPFHSKFNFAFNNVGTKFNIVATAPEIFQHQLQSIYDQYQQSQIQLGLTKPEAGTKEVETAEADSVAIPEVAEPSLGLVAQQPQAQRSVMRFELRHAWVEDRQIGDLKFPGVIKVLTELVKASRGGAQVSQAPAASPTQPSANTGIQGIEPFGAKQVSNTSATGSSSATNQKQPGVSPTQPLVTFDPRTNAVLIYDEVTYHDFYKNLIDDLDHPLQMVELQAMVIDVNKNSVDELGITWTGHDGVDKIEFNGGFSTTGNSQLGDINLIVDSGGFIARLRALNEQGRSKVVSQPSVLAMDNHTANIETKDKFYVRVEGNAQAGSALFPVETGTMLSVTPHVIDDSNSEHRSIQLLVSIKDGTINREAEALVDTLPTISERNINTQAVVYHGESLLIGGQVHSTNSTSEAGVPVLSTLPVFGNLFSKSGKVNRELVRMFLLRPTIVEMSYSRVTESSKNSSEIHQEHINISPTRIYIPPLNSDQQTKKPVQPKPENKDDPHIDIEVYLPDATRSPVIQVSDIQPTANQDFSETMLLRMSELDVINAETAQIRLGNK